MITWGNARLAALAALTVLGSIAVGVLVAGAAGGAAGGLYRAWIDAPAIETHYAPAENLEAIDVALIGSARRRIDLAAFVLTDVAVIEALASAARRGVAVRLYLETPDPDRDPGETVRAALARLKTTPGVAARYKPPGEAYMHLKSYCVDAALLRSGAGNFSASGLKRQDNDLIMIRGPNACAGFTAHFERMWAR